MFFDPWGFLVAPRRRGIAADWPETARPFMRWCWLSHGFREKSSATPHPTPPLHAPTSAHVFTEVSLVLQGFSQNSCAEPERRRHARARCRVGASTEDDGLLVRVGAHALRLLFGAPRLL